MIKKLLKNRLFKNNKYISSKGKKEGLIPIKTRVISNKRENKSARHISSCEKDKQNDQKEKNKQNFLIVFVVCLVAEKSALEQRKDEKGNRLSN